MSTSIHKKPFNSICCSMFFCRASKENTSSPFDMVFKQETPFLSALIFNRQIVPVESFVKTYLVGFGVILRPFFP